MCAVPLIFSDTFPENPDTKDVADKRSFFMMNGGQSTFIFFQEVRASLGTDLYKIYLDLLAYRGDFSATLYNFYPYCRGLAPPSLKPPSPCSQKSHNPLFLSQEVWASERLG